MIYTKTCRCCPGCKQIIKENIGASSKMITMIKINTLICSSCYMKDIDRWENDGGH